MAAWMQRSGPMPPGSPGVMASGIMVSVQQKHLHEPGEAKNQVPERTSVRSGCDAHDPSFVLLRCPTHECRGLQLNEIQTDFLSRRLRYSEAVVSWRSRNRGPIDRLGPNPDPPLWQHLRDLLRNVAPNQQTLHHLPVRDERFALVALLFPKTGRRQV